MKSFLKVLAGLAVFGAGAGLAQASTSWGFTFDSTTAGNNTNPSPAYGNVRSFSYGASSTMSASAWAGTAHDASGDPNRMDIESAYLAVYNTNGLGVVNRDGNTTNSQQVSSSVVRSSLSNDETVWQDRYEYVGGGTREHAMDNDQRYDVILFSFSDMVALQSLRLGWWSNDSDVTVLAWGGPPAAPVMGAGTSTDFKSMGTTGSGWQLVSNISDPAYVSQSFNQGSPIYSKFRLVGAGGFSQTASGGGMNKGCVGCTKTDFVKLASIGGITMAPPPPPPPGNQVPEPGSLALAGMALFGLWRLRSRG